MKKFLMAAVAACMLMGCGDTKVGKPAPVSPADTCEKCTDGKVCPCEAKECTCPKEVK